jgi:hypothetical protein
VARDERDAPGVVELLPVVEIQRRGEGADGVLEQPLAVVEQGRLREETPGDVSLAGEVLERSVRGLGGAERGAHGGGLQAAPSVRFYFEVIDWSIGRRTCPRGRSPARDPRWDCRARWASGPVHAT